MEKDFSHTVLSAPVWHDLNAAQAGPQLLARSVHQLGKAGE
jgi:conjugal transfer/entry exclusion protein